MMNARTHVLVSFLAAWLVVGCRPPAKATTALTPQVPPSATAAAISPTPAPASTAITEVRVAPTTAAAAPDVQAEILPPLLVDSEAGLIYATAQDAGGRAGTAVLAAGDGRLLALYDAAGPLGLDPARGLLYVDRGNDGLMVLSARTGTLLRTVALPPLPEGAQQPPPPQADTQTGRVLMMRGETVLVVDGETGQLERTVAFDVRPEDNCRIPHDQPLPIAGAQLDATSGILYLDFLTYVCTPWFGYTVLSYDLRSGEEISRLGSEPFQAAASGSDLYGASWHRFGIGTLWGWRRGTPRLSSTDWGGAFGGLQADALRRRLYLVSGGELRVLAAETLQLEMVAPLPAPGRLVGYDPGTDQLYFLSAGRLSPCPVSAIHAPVPQPPLEEAPPPRPVSLLAVSPGWPQDRTAFGIWGSEQPAGEAYVFDQNGGALFARDDLRRLWLRPFSGLPQGSAITALALSPAYTEDRTLFAGASGAGLFRSTDGGALWQPTGALPSMGIREILVSPGYAQDRTLYVRVRTTGLLRSTDGGDTWQALGAAYNLVALSPDLAQDHTLVAASWAEDRQRAVLFISRDAGDHWQPLGDAPGREGLLALSVAPAFDKWGVLFALDRMGTLYRSGDAGRSWQAVSDAGLQNPMGGQIVYGPRETNRPVFLLVTAPDAVASPPAMEGRLFRSGDGGLTWQEVALPGDAVPTALAISPAFGEDGLILVGTADGRLMVVDGLALPARG